ncbi:MAG: hypothetical protein B1H40_02635 [Candidatus Latescibacteria bacterium 4484_181]|nr:MAG: hypothetical protein B1H40_02635 [Candidatus Latescibacteria bacterium 4484_181]RKY69682.1 MAG: hypothetical protein DRQ02_00320 [Candidatus Latescibacterota bacterium]RKY73557.1 MAG: hypothetical protein DRQ24_02120 [Candidatus Latescibacterota bacterium]
MRRQVPLVITFVAGIIMIIQYFIPHEPFAGLQQRFNVWFLIISAFALILGIGNLIKIHGERISRQSAGWGYSVVLLVGLVTMSVVGIGWGIEPGTPFFYLFWNIQIPLSSTMFALLAFFIASASYRAFRARSFEATLLLAAAILVMLGRVPLGNFLWHRLPAVATWIMNYPNTAGQRAIMIGIALGVISSSLRIILGIERGLGGGQQ